jgi:hypothetical protein
MKPQNVIAIFGAALLLVLTGCEGTSIGYDPSKAATTSPNDKIAVTAIDVSPDKPVAMKPWRVNMHVKNLGAQPLEDVRYEFLVNGREDNKMGTGKIPRIDPGQTVEVSSMAGTKLDQGSYRIEGRVFLDKNEETAYADRMDNWKSVQFNVAQ